MIALINPPFKEKSTYSFTYERAKYPHPSLVSLAGYMVKKSIPFQIIDSKFDELTVDELIDKLKLIDANIIGITSSTTEINHVHSIIRRIRQNFPAAFIVLGGVHATALPLETLEANTDIDVLISGEGEFPLEQLANAEDKFAVLPDIAGAYYRKNGKVVKSVSQVFDRDIKEYGRGAFHLWSKAAKYFVLTYRGCPFPCSFCFRAFGTAARLREVEDVLADLQFIADNYPDSELSIVDATFGLHKQHTETILNEMIKRGINKKLKWSCGTRVDVIDVEMLRLMRKAGCVTVSYGIESGSNRILKATGKNITVEKCMKAVKASQKLGLETVGYYIFGHIGETKGELQETLRLIWKMNCDKIAVGVMVPWPGTKVFELAKKNQGGYKLLSTDYAKYDKYFGDVMEFEGYDLKYLDIMRIKAFVYLYLKNYRFVEFTRFMWVARGQAFKKLKQLILPPMKVAS